MNKKILFLALPLVVLIACTMNNTPTSKVEEFFSKYQQLDKEITSEITMILNEETMTESQKNRYRKILEKQYKNLTYQIKEEIIDGNSATVNIEIEVIDYKKSINNLVFNTNNYTKETYEEEKLNRLENAKEKVKYRLELTLTKNQQGIWNLDPLTEQITKKIQGMY